MPTYKIVYTYEYWYELKIEAESEAEALQKFHDEDYTTEPRLMGEGLQDSTQITQLN